MESFMAPRTVVLAANRWETHALASQGAFARMGLGQVWVLGKGKRAVLRGVRRENRNSPRERLREARRPAKALRDKS